MNKQAVASELVKVARLLLAGDLIAEFTKEAKDSRWKYYALFRNKKAVGKPKKSGHWSSRSLTEERVRQVAITPISLDVQHDFVAFTFVGTQGLTDTYLLSEKPYYELVGEEPPPKKVHEIAAEIKDKLVSLGLSSLGQRYGKAGEFFGIEGGSRTIAVGHRDLLLNRLQVSISHPEDAKTPDTRWTMKESMLLSKVDDEFLRRAVDWAKAGTTSVALREKARQEYAQKNDYTVVFG